ncbi:uncharacterized protein LOC122251235 [Penaeus japonicus]|uniref:uncharacterized protein LOC122251235 n=1 Tax=Penaeus japonicus TaxID=27405 RepID=UPI001C70BF64|nr:uncharacterized protein LOC122251235 [Penaeus japonicus]
MWLFVLPIGHHREKKKYIKLCIGPNSCPRLLVCLDEHQSKTSGNCLSLEVKEAKEWQGTAAWEYFSFKIVTSDCEYIISAANERERNLWLEDVAWTFFRSPVGEESAQASVIENSHEYENPYKYSRSFMGTPDAVTSQCLGVGGCVILFINGFYLTVTSPDGNRLGRFNICNLRRYGFTAKTFHVETGRKSMFGEGTFTFFTTQGKHIIANWKEDVRQAKLTGNVNLTPGELEPPAMFALPAFTKPGHTYAKCEEVVESCSSFRQQFLDSDSTDEEVDTKEAEPRSPKGRTFSSSAPVRSACVDNTHAPTANSSFREHEWQIKTTMVLEFAKEFCKGDKRRYCEILNHFLVSHGMTPLPWDWGAEVLVRRGSEGSGERKDSMEDPLPEAS